MGASGQIGNRALLQSVADFLQMEGVRRAPGILNTDIVNVVYDLASQNGGALNRTIIEGENLFNSVDGLISPDFRVLGDPSVSTSPLKDNPGLETRVLALDYVLEFDAAGALLFNGKTIEMQLFTTRQGVGFQTVITCGNPWITVATAKTRYRWALGGVQNGSSSFTPSWTGYVPSSRDLWLRLEVTDGTAFPANTDWSIFTSMVQQPEQMQLPS